MTAVFHVESAVGRWRGFVTARGVARLDFLRRDDAPPAGAAVVDRHAAARELAEYFAGARREFTVPLDFSACAPFQRRVLEALYRVPFGGTVTYGELARAAGSPRAARAVGQAVGSNPLPVLVPCHRVLAAGGRIGGFALGLDVKRVLLALEGISA